MCGIVAILNTQGEAASPVHIKNMTDSLSHRGPDGEGRFVDGEFATGHRRLSIIDLSDSGAQPMLDPSGRYVLSYNGEIYNFKELKTELLSLGHQFIGSSDSEVLLHCFLEWGKDCVAKLNGMFSFLIWDKTRRTLFAARDRYGIKPLYYYQDSRRLLFSSEVKAFWEIPDVQKRLSYEGLSEYMSFQNFLSTNTLFENVKLFPAGHFAEVSTDDPQVRLHQYWDFHFESSALSEADCKEKLTFLIKQAVNRQLVADVELGAYLSGGMDSSCVTAVASKSLPYMKTYTVGFDMTDVSNIEASFDERHIAEKMAYLFKTEQYEMVLKSGDMERSISKIVRHLEEPRVGQCYPNYYAAQLASKFTKVVLAGVGGDEIFAGYPWRYYRSEKPMDFDKFVQNYYKKWQRLIPEKEKHRILSPIWDKIKHVDSFEIFSSVFAKKRQKLISPEDFINASLYFESKTFLHGLLVVEDKLSMSHGMESRVPLLDNDLVDFAQVIPLKYKLSNLGNVEPISENLPGKLKESYRRTKDGKIIFRKVMKELIPERFTDLNKQGFSAPDATWFRRESKGYTTEKLFGDHSALFDCFDKKEVTKTVENHFSGKENKRLLIWSLLYLNEMFRQF